MNNVTEDEVFDAVSQERAYQRMSGHGDDEDTTITCFANQIQKQIRVALTEPETKKRMVCMRKIAALAVAAQERHGVQRRAREDFERFTGVHSG